MKSTLPMILEVMKKIELKNGTTSHIASVLEEYYPEWKRSVREIRERLKELKRLGYVEDLETAYGKQLRWKMIEKKGR